LLVISPHLDDAVLSLRGVIGAHPGSTVATVCAQPPADRTLLMPSWDNDGRFASSFECVMARQAEDAVALEHLGAHQLLLDFVDRQYGSNSQASVTKALVRVISDHPDRDLYGPLGVGHADHELVAASFLLAALQSGRRTVWIYEDVPYRLERPDLFSAKLGSLRRQGWHLRQEHPHLAPPEVREAALQSYAIELPKLGDRPIRAPETVWRASLVKRRSERGALLPFGRRARRAAVEEPAGD